MLQLFIQTNRRESLHYSQTFISSDVPDPIPEGAESSLMINSRIFFGSVLPQSLTNGWAFGGNNPGNLALAWNGSFSSGIVQANVFLNDLGGISRKGDIRITYKPYYDNPQSWSIDGMTIDSGKDGSGRMTMTFEGQRVFYFDRFRSAPNRDGNGGPRETTVEKLSTDFALNIVATLPTEIGGSGRDQTVKINVTAPDVAVSARTSGGGPCGSDDLQAKVNAELKEKLPPQLTSKMNVSFRDVSVFALKNLLFPSKNYLDLQSVYVPGDLLILGNFKTDA